MQMIYYAQGFFFLVLLNLCLLQDILEVTEEQNPQLVQFILDNKADFLRLVLEQPQEPNNGGDRYETYHKC